MYTNFQLKSNLGATATIPARLFLLRSLATCAIALCLSNALFASTVQMNFGGVNGTQMFGYYVGPYSGTMNGTPVDLFCVDFANEVNFGQQWDANVTPITSGSDLSDTRYGGAPDALELYQQAAWLALQFASQPTSQYGDIQATIWRLFNASAPTPSSSWWMEQAGNNYASGDYGDFRLVTNTGPVRMFGQVQEFLIRTQSNPAPEPSTQLFVGLALVGVSCVWRSLRRRRSNSLR
jgi:hypothetical protein